jgi:hypothetical protein
MEKGFAQVPLERYNQLMLENYRLNMELNNIAKIETDWNNEPVLKIDLSVLAAIINNKFKQSEFADKYTMIDLSNRVETIWDAFKAKPQADEDQA